MLSHFENGELEWLVEESERHSFAIGLLYAHDGAGCGYFSIFYLKHLKICNSLP